MQSAAGEKTSVAVNSRKPENDSTSKPDRSKKLKNIQKGMVK